MDISVRTRKKGCDVEVDFFITNMNIENLPSFSADEIRAMIVPQLESIQRTSDLNPKSAKLWALLDVYGEERCRELFPEFFDNAEV